jgi:hypothetical protein
VARGILKGLDHRGTVWFPTWSAWALAKAAAWFPAPFDAFLDRWAPAHFEREHERDRVRSRSAEP